MSSSSSSKPYNYILLSSTIAAVSSTAALGLYFYWLHHNLRKSTKRITRSGTLAATHSVSLDNLETVPKKEVFESGRYFSVYDRAWRVVRKGELPDEDELLRHSEEQSRKMKTTILNNNKDGDGESFEAKLLTTYLRRNMTAFARYLPQSYIMRISVSNAAQKRTFDPAYIQSLYFREGDVVCGVYRVLLRREAKVEFGIDFPASSGVEGRLVIGMTNTSPSQDDSGGEEEVEIYSETAMWRDADTRNVVMPLERTVPRIMHELASWWLLDSGVSYLVGLRGR